MNDARQKVSVWLCAGTPDAGEINGREPLGMTAKNGAPGGSFWRQERG